MDDMLYLDIAATSPLHPEVLNAMMPFLTEQFANPSSLHSAGQSCKDAVERARQQVAGYLNTTPAQITWTSGGTESDNLAILGVMRALKAQGDPRGLAVSAIEHSAVLEAARYLERYEGIPLHALAADKEGRITPESLDTLLGEHPKALVSIMHANNETGTLNPIGDLSAIAHQHGALFHTDAVQSFAKCALDMAVLKHVDYLSATAHKCGGPRGAGILYLSENALTPHPIVMGGAQEKGMRGGTLNTPAIVGFGKAVEMLQHIEHKKHLVALREKTTYFMEGLLPLQEQGLLVNSPQHPDHRVAGILNVSIPNKSGDALVLKFDMHDIMVSSGSACHAETIEPSHVILAQTNDVARAQSTLRFSFDASLTHAHIDRVVALLKRQL